jgi:hypothetical protein
MRNKAPLVESLVECYSIYSQDLVCVFFSPYVSVFEVMGMVRGEIKALTGTVRARVSYSADSTCCSLP